MTRCDNFKLQLYASGISLYRVRYTHTDKTNVLVFLFLSFFDVSLFFKFFFRGGSIMVHSRL